MEQSEPIHQLQRPTSLTHPPDRHVTYDLGQPVSAQHVPVPFASQRSKWEGATLPLELESATRADAGRAEQWRWLFIACVASGLVIVVWSVYSLLKYALAMRATQGASQRRVYASAFASLASVNLAVTFANLAIVFFGFKISWFLHVLDQFALFLSSACLLIPAVFNVAVIILARDDRIADPSFSLSQRCHDQSDVVWSKEGSGCTGAVPWGHWLSAAIVRLILTTVIVLAFQWLVWLQIPKKPPPPSPAQPSQSSASLIPHTGSNKLRRKRPPSLHLAPDSSSSVDVHRRTLSSSTQTHQQSISSLPYVPHHLARPSVPITTTIQASVVPLSPQSTTLRSSLDSMQNRSVGSRSFEEERWPQGYGLHDYTRGQRSASPEVVSERFMTVDDAGDLNRFAVSFRSLVERVARDTEAASRLSSASPTSPGTSNGEHLVPSRRRSYSPPLVCSPDQISTRNSPSPHHRPPRLDFVTADAELLRQQLLQAHRIMLLEQAERAESYEHVLVLGNSVRRMSTIPSILEEPRTPSSSATSGTYATPRELTRSPTSSTTRSGRRNPMARQTEEVASASDCSTR